MERIRIGVGAITRARPVLFAGLADSLARMHRPEGAEIVFLFVENASTLSVSDAADRLRAATGCRVRVETEPRPGIPMARNRVLDLAFEEACDVLAFVDDDETVRADWLTCLHGALQARGLDLAGGPVSPGVGAVGLSPMQAACLAVLRGRAAKRNRRRADRTAAGRDGDAAARIYTNNWAARLATVRRLGVRFDESLQFAGGSDTRFSLDMQAGGARLGWVPGAVVDEIVPPARLTLRYQYARARDQAANSVRLRRLGPGAVLGYAALRGLAALAQGLTIPVAGRPALVRAVHEMGLAAGRLRGGFGWHSRHYAPGTEDVHGEGGEGRG